MLDKIALSISMCLKQAFCSHQWRQVSSADFVIKNRLDDIVGTVTLTLHECHRCKKEKITRSKPNE